MTPLLFVVVPIMAFVTVVLIAVALVAPQETALQQRLRAYGYDAAGRPAGDLSRPFFQRVLLPVGRRIGQLAYRLTPGGLAADSRQRLRQAHQPMSLGTFLLLRLAMAILLPALYVYYALRFAGGINMFSLLVILFLIYAGHRLPDIWLTFRIDERRDQITRALPDALDLIVVCVEAGSSLEAAIAKVVESTHGPLTEEFAQMLAEVGLGRSRRTALHEMSDRCGSPDLQTFVAAIIQADQMGVDISTALRVQADAMRVRRRQRAEELIAKAPVKMLFPMAAFIFPALLVVVLGPAMIKILAMFSSLGTR